MIRLTCLLVLVSTCHANQKASGKPSLKIQPQDVKFSISSDGSGDIPLNYPATHSKVLDLENTQLLKLSFDVADQAGKKVDVHQSFVIFIHEATKQEVAYVVEPSQSADSSSYVFELNMKAYAKEFNGLSGKYDAHLILADTSVNPVDWVFAKVNVHLPSQSGTKSPAAYGVQPEIQHLFREPEARPPTLFAHLFAAICAAPFAILLLSWLRIGINFGRLPLSLWVIGFHGGLAAVFGLYLCFWIQLDMFQTLYYLALVLVPTFLFGHRLFRTLASEK